MWLSLKYGTIPLADGRLLAIRGARGVEVECTTGRVWLTVEGQPGDILLGPGERSLITGQGLALVEGLPAGAVRLLKPASRLQRTWQALHGPARAAARQAAGAGTAAPERPTVFG
jgi:hypothetical protein